MNRRKIIPAIVVALTLASISFQAGRRFEIANTISNSEKKSELGLSLPSQQDRQSEFKNLLVRDISTVSFADLYDVLRSGSIERRSEWFCELQALPKGPRQNVAISSFFKTLVQLDVDEAIDLVEHLQDRRLREIASDAIFNAAPTRAMPDMAKFFLRTSYRTTGVTGHLGEAIEQWSLVDPVAVSQFFDEHSGNQDLQGCFDTLLFQWAKLDPESAKDWFERQKPFPDTEDGKRNLSDAVHGFVFGWFNHDKSAALDFAISNAANEAFQETIHNLGLSLFLKSVDESTNFIKQLPTASLQAETVKNVVTYTTTGVLLGYQDPADKRSAETMMKWIVTLPEDAWSDEIAPLAMIWEQDNPAVFSSWLAQQSPQTKDRIVYEQCISSSHEMPREVLAQAENIGDPQVREKALTTYALSFGTTPDASIRLLRKTNLSDEQKAYLSRLVQEHREEDNEK